MVGSNVSFTGNSEFAKELVCILSIDEVVHNVERGEFATNDWCDFLVIELLENPCELQRLWGMCVFCGVLDGSSLCQDTRCHGEVLSMYLIELKQWKRSNYSRSSVSLRIPRILYVAVLRR